MIFFLWPWNARRKNVASFQKSLEVTYAPHPRQAVPAAELPWGDCGGAGAAFQNNVGGLRVCQKVKFSTHGRVPSCWRVRKHRCPSCSTSWWAGSINGKRFNGPVTFYVASHDVDALQSGGQGRVHFDSKCQVGEGPCCDQDHLHREIALRFTFLHCIAWQAL